MLECGAVYRNLPPHAVAFSDSPDPLWTLQQAQVWDCYGTEFDVIKYVYLADLTARYDGTENRATCLFTACPHGERTSRNVSQYGVRHGKAFKCRTVNGVTFITRWM